jgi:predicted nuclease with TOPRIM domain
MGATEKETLMEEIAQLQREVNERRSRLSQLSQDKMSMGDPYVIVPGDSEEANLRKLQALIEEIGKRSSGGDSVKDIAEMREL